MSVAGGCLIREAEPGLDDDAVAALMVDYLTWAIERLASEYGVDEPPTSVASSGRTVELPSAIRETCSLPSATDAPWVSARSER